MPLVFSTSWNASRLTRAREMFFEIKKLGFLDLELSFNLLAPMIGEIKELLWSSDFKVRSLHNFCPIPEGLKREEALPDYYSISSLDKEERDLAIRFTKRSIDTAGLLGAKVVILHCGRVEMQDQTRKLISFYDQDMKDTVGFRELKEDFLRERAAISQPFLDYALDSLADLNKYARGQAVYLGVENRFYYREIPNLEEIGIILDEFRSSNIFYWHDTGHAQVMENLGLAKHKDYLDLYGKAMIGTHLHNVVGCLDHQAPVTGQFDFSVLKPYLRKETFKVIEAHRQATASEIKKSKELLESIFDGLI